MSQEQSPESLHVLLVDDDKDVRAMIHAVLTDEGYAVSTLSGADQAEIAAEVGRVEPDCILLDGAGASGRGDSWMSAAYLSARERAVPTVMMTADSNAVREARERSSDRASAADFTAVLSKPFLLDELLYAVETAAGRSQRFDRSEAADDVRTAELAEELRAAGATDIRTSKRREWATFASPSDDRIYQLYWWQLNGLYILGRYDADARLEMISQHFDRREAIAAALSRKPDTEA